MVPSRTVSVSGSALILNYRYHTFDVAVAAIEGSSVQHVRPWCSALHYAARAFAGVRRLKKSQPEVFYHHLLGRGVGDD